MTHTYPWTWAWWILRLFLITLIMYYHVLSTFTIFFLKRTPHRKTRFFHWTSAWISVACPHYLLIQSQVHPNASPYNIIPIPSLSEKQTHQLLDFYIFIILYIYIYISHLSIISVSPINWNPCYATISASCAGELLLGPLPRSSSLISNGSTVSLQRTSSVQANGRPYPPGLGWTPQVTPHDEGTETWNWGENNMWKKDVNRMWSEIFWVRLNFGDLWKTLRIWTNFWEVDGFRWLM